MPPSSCVKARIGVLLSRKEKRTVLSFWIFNVNYVGVLIFATEEMGPPPLAVRGILIFTNKIINW